MDFESQFGLEQLNVELDRDDSRLSLEELESPGDRTRSVIPASSLQHVTDLDLGPPQELIRAEVVSIKDCQAENVLIEVLDQELHAGVPMRVGS